MTKRKFLANFKNNKIIFADQEEVEEFKMLLKEFDIKCSTITFNYQRDYYKITGSQGKYVCLYGQKMTSQKRKYKEFNKLMEKVMGESDE